MLENPAIQAKIKDSVGAAKKRPGLRALAAAARTTSLDEAPKELDALGPLKEAN